MSSSAKCGQHVELAANDAVRVTRCNCGTVHVTLLASGVTVRVSADVLRGTAAGIRAALEKMGESTQHGSTSIN